MDRDILDAGQQGEPWKQLVELFDDSKNIYSPPYSILRLKASLVCSRLLPSYP